MFGIDTIADAIAKVASLSEKIFLWKTSPKQQEIKEQKEEDKKVQDVQNAIEKGDNKSISEFLKEQK